GLHHRARARRVIQLFMNGGVSQVDTFDYKPRLQRLHGRRFAPGEHVEAVTSTPGNVLGSPFRFRRHGQCGRWVSSVFPHLARHVDDMAFLMSVLAGTVIHVGAPSPIADLHPPRDARHITPQSEAEGQALLREMNREHLEQAPGDSRLEARIASYELAARMQLSAPEALDLARETEA